MLVFLLTMMQTLGQSTGPSDIGNDPVAELQRRIDTGAATLQFEDGQGYLRSLLKNLKIPVSSQSLVFSKSSFQLDLISPKTPRAIYVNDDVYIGFVQEGPLLELVSIDPK